MADIAEELFICCIAKGTVIKRPSAWAHLDVRGYHARDEHDIAMAFRALANIVIIIFQAFGLA